MTVENSSMLGYVFIISGIAIAILAYAIYLNLRDVKSKTGASDNEQRSKVEGTTPAVSDKKIQTIKPLSEPLDDAEENILIEIPLFQEDSDSPRPQEMEAISDPMPEIQDLTPIATILREVDTGNLILRIGDREYTNVEDLMDSTHWSRIERLSSDLTQWLKSTKANVTSIKAPSPDPIPIEKKPNAPQSMVEEINQILERKLRTEDVDRKAIKIIEMLDGTVKVYIGVDSYPIDEVPFEDVRGLIREAVSEWEGIR